jgi:hypothetical protein
MELKPIDQTTRGRGQLHAALSLYRKLVEEEARNPEPQILYWIDHSKENLADEFRCFAIRNAKEVVGYLQYSYFNEEHIFFFEYFCMRPGKGGLVPTPAVNCIEEFLARNYRPDFTIVFDVAHKQVTSDKRVPDTKRLDYFTRLGFRKIDVGYQYPVLQTYGESSYSADLMVLLPGGRTEVTPTEMRTILRCVYFKHYLRWDRPFLDPAEFAARERLINNLYSSQIAQIATREKFDTFGDNRRLRMNWMAKYQPSVRALLRKIFTPKMPQLITWIVLLLLIQWLLGSVWLLIPFAVVLVILDCLTKDTADSQKLLVAIISKFRLSGPQ